MDERELLGKHQRDLMVMKKKEERDGFGVIELCRDAGSCREHRATLEPKSMTDFSKDDFYE